MSGSGTGTPAVVTSGLFAVADARTFDKCQLASETDYPDVVVAAKEAEIRTWLEKVCAVNFVSTTHSLEYHSGDGSQLLQLDWPRISAVTAVAYRDDQTWTAFTADELADLMPFSEVGDMLYREGAWWPVGVRNLRVTYTAGYTAVPDLVKRAALTIAVNELPVSNVPWQADGYDAGGTSYSWSKGDGYNGQWSEFPAVMKAIRMYDQSIGGIA